jgi:hypothetical protein
MSGAISPLGQDALLASRWRDPDILARPTSSWQRRLALVVPYRDRADQIAAFLPWIHDYFRFDKHDRHIRYHVHVVEQADDLPFNRGALLNAAARLIGDDADYLCAHDVDMLPVWADYAWPDHPARLGWHGRVFQEDPLRYFGGVVAMSLDDYRRVNGYSNGYWGWGFEDLDLQMRVVHAGLSMERRDGNYRVLRHPHHGYSPAGAPSEANQRNRERFTALNTQGFAGNTPDGLDSVRFMHLDSGQPQLAGKRFPNTTWHRVRLAR